MELDPPRTTLNLGWVWGAHTFEIRFAVAKRALDGIDPLEPSPEPFHQCIRQTVFNAWNLLRSEKTLRFGLQFLDRYAI